MYIHVYILQYCIPKIVKKISASSHCILAAGASPARRQARQKAAPELATWPKHPMQVALPRGSCSCRHVSESPRGALPLPRGTAAPAFHVAAPAPPLSWPSVVAPRPGSSASRTSSVASTSSAVASGSCSVPLGSSSGGWRSSLVGSRRSSLVSGLNIVERGPTLVTARSRSVPQGLTPVLVGLNICGLRSSSGAGDITLAGSALDPSEWGIRSILSRRRNSVGSPWRSRCLRAQAQVQTGADSSLPAAYQQLGRHVASTEPARVPASPSPMPLGLADSALLFLGFIACAVRGCSPRRPYLSVADCGLGLGAGLGSCTWLGMVCKADVNHDVHQICTIHPQRRSQGKFIASQSATSQQLLSNAFWTRVGSHVRGGLLCSILPAGAENVLTYFGGKLWGNTAHCSTLDAAAVGHPHLESKSSDAPIACA